LCLYNERWVRRENALENIAGQSSTIDVHSAMDGKYAYWGLRKPNNRTQAVENNGIYIWKYT
jgi:hypothetical protein